MIFYVTACVTLLKCLGIACTGANPVALATLLIVGTIFRVIGFKITINRCWQLDI